MKTPSEKTPPASSGGMPWRYIAAGGGVLALGAALDCLSSRRCSLHQESLLDEALDETFPASDPVSTQDFTSPDERLAQ
jgi:hypothetical protein